MNAIVFRCGKYERRLIVSIVACDCRRCVVTSSRCVVTSSRCVVTSLRHDIVGVALCRSAGAGGDPQQQQRRVPAARRLGRLRPEPDRRGPLRRRQHLQLAEAHLHLHGEPAPRPAADLARPDGERRAQVHHHRRARHVLVRVRHEPAVLVLRGDARRGVPQVSQRQEQRPARLPLRHHALKVSRRRHCPFRPPPTRRAGTILEITMRYVSRYLRYDTYHDTSSMLGLIDYQAKIKEA